MNRSVAALAVVAALSVTGWAVAQNTAKEPAKASAFTPAQREELDKAIHEYIVKNPEVLIEATTALEEKQQAAADAKRKEAVVANAKALRDSPEGTVLGNPKGDVTLIEFFDYNCGYCKAIFPKVMDAIKADGKVRLVLKELPILGPSSETASRAALASVKQGKYTAFHTALMGHKGALNDEEIMKIAKDTGLDVAKLEKDMESPDFDKVLSQNEDLARSVQLEGTPMMIVGDTPLRYAVDSVEKGELKDLIMKARGK